MSFIYCAAKYQKIYSNILNIEHHVIVAERHGNTGAFLGFSEHNSSAFEMVLKTKEGGVILLLNEMTKECTLINPLLLHI